MLPPSLLSGYLGLLSLLLLGLGGALRGQSVFVNELHYDNAGTDVEEGVEIAGPAGTDLSGYDVVFYNGANGGLSTSIAGGAVMSLTGRTIPNSGAGYGAVWFPKSGIENGAPDGLALVVRATGQVVQFLSWEGTFAATAGPANGLVSTDIGVSESGSGATNLSLQLSGVGTQYTQFTWAAAALSTHDLPNRNQTLGGVTYTTTFSVTPSTLAESGGTTTATGSLQISPAPPASVTFSITNGDATEITVPATVVVPTSGSATFPIQSVNDNIADGDQQVQLTVTDTQSIYPAKSAALTVTDSAPNPPAWGGTLRIATLNVLNGVGGSASAEFAAVREILLRLAPDVIAFQEVQDTNAFQDLKALVTAIGFPTSRQHLATDGDAFAGSAYSAGDFSAGTQSVAIASRFPISQAVQIGRGVAGRKEMTRYPLFVKIDIPGVADAADPAVVAVHLKASQFDDSRFRRLIETYRISEFLTDSGYSPAVNNVFVLGDFNEQDEPGQPASYFTGIDPATHIFADGTKLIAGFQLGSDLTGANAKTLTYATFPHSSMNAFGLTAPVTRQADGSTASFITGGNARLDYIFASQSTVTQGLARVEIYNSRLEHAFDGWRKAESQPSSPELSQTASDHFCVYGDFALGQMPKIQVTPLNRLVTEGGAPVSINLTLPQPPEAGNTVTVSLSAVRPGLIRLGKSQISFTGAEVTAEVPVEILNTPQVDPQRRVTLIASASGYFPGEASLDVRNVDAGGQVIISQYIENASGGTTPKAVELLNMTGTTLDFSKHPLLIRRYSNGDTIGEQEARIAAGMLASGLPVVIGDGPTGEYLLAQGILVPDPLQTPTSAPTGHSFFDSLGNLRFYKDSFTYNGDDALEVVLNYYRMDVFGTIGIDPGTAWTGGGVSTTGQNIELRPHLGTGCPGFSNPSLRFATVSTTDALTGFGLAPGIADDYLTWASGNAIFGINAAPTADFDGDGIRNLLEYAFNTDPRLGSAQPLQISRSGNAVFLRMTRRTARPGLIYGWEGSPDLVIWGEALPTQTSQILLPGGMEDLSWSDTIAAARKFWRIKVARE